MHKAPTLGSDHVEIFVFLQCTTVFENSLYTLLWLECPLILYPPLQTQPLLLGSHYFPSRVGQHLLSKAAQGWLCYLPSYCFSVSPLDYVLPGDLSEWMQRTGIKWMGEWQDWNTKLSTQLPILFPSLYSLSAAKGIPRFYRVISKLKSSEER